MPKAISSFLLKESGRFVDHDTHAAMSLSKFIKSSDDILTMCLEPILHHSSVANYAKDIVELNGLPLLMEIHNRFKDNVYVNITLSKIMANICSYPELLDDIFRSGNLQKLNSKNVLIKNK